MVMIITIIIRRSAQVLVIANALNSLMGSATTSKKRIKSILLISILHDYGTEGKTCAEADQADLHSTFQNALFNSFVQSYGDRCA